MAFGTTVRTFCKGHKKGVIIGAAIIAVLAVTAVLCFTVLFNPIRLRFAEQYLAQGDYQKAYFQLRACRSSREVTARLADFIVLYEKEITVSYDENGAVTSKSETVCDENENVITTFRYDASGKALGKTVYTCDDSGNVLLAVTYDKNGTVTGKVECDYENGRQTYYAAFDKDGRLQEETEFLYNGSGQLTATQRVNQHVEIVEKEHYTYNAVGDCTERVRYDQAGVVQARSAYEYDAVGRVTKRTAYDANGAVMATEAYTYDKYGNVTLYTHHDENGTLTIHERTEYAYDKNGLPSRAVVCNANGNRVSETTYNNPIVVYNPQ